LIDESRTQTEQIRDESNEKSIDLPASCTENIKTRIPPEHIYSCSIKNKTRKTC
jgi:hypothetical protein